MPLQFSFKLPPDQEEYIIARAAALGMDGATPFVRAIINKWFESGCPPIAPAENRGYTPPPFKQSRKKLGQTEGPGIGEEHTAPARASHEQRR